MSIPRQLEFVSEYEPDNARMIKVLEKLLALDNLSDTSYEEEADSTKPRILH